MSKPASLVLQCPITPEALKRCLAARLPRPSAWDDWHLIEAGVSPDELAQLDLQANISVAGFLRQLRGMAEHPADWLCAYDAETRMMTIGQAHFSDDRAAIIASVAILRRFGTFTEAGQPAGIILIHDWIFGRNGTIAAVSLEAGRSVIRRARNPDPEGAALIIPILRPVRAAVVADSPAPIRDDLDRLAEEP